MTAGRKQPRLQPTRVLATVLALVAGIATMSAATTTAAATSTFTAATRPLVAFGSDAELNCFPQNVSSDWLQFWASDAAQPPEFSSATLVSVSGVGLFGPRGFADGNGLVAGRTLHSYLPIAQTVSARRVRTTVALPGTALMLVQTETYDRGDSLRVAVDVRNGAGTNANVVVYRTGDCFPGDDVSYAITGAGSVGCEEAFERGVIARPSPGDIFIRFQPLAAHRHAHHELRGSTRHQHRDHEPTVRATSIAGDVHTVRAAIATGAALAGTCECGTPLDAAAALSWSLPVPAHDQATVSHLLTMSTGEGRRATTMTGQLSGHHGHWLLTARVRVAGRPLAGVPVLFERGSLTACTAVTDARGRAICRTDGRPDIFTATTFGDTTSRPASTRFGHVDPYPPAQPPSFPACAQFDAGPGGIELAITGDGHYQQVIATTHAPPCPTVLYRARSYGHVIGEVRGDERATNLFGDPVAGFVYLYLDDQHASGCIVLESVDLRTGAVIDTAPSATSGKPCLDEVAGQKFR